MGEPVREKQKMPCPYDGCGSSDAFHVYLDDKGYEYGKCYSCGGGGKLIPDDDLISYAEKQSPVDTVWKERSAVPHRYRGISTETLNSFGVTASLSYETGAAEIKEIVFSYKDLQGKKIAEKSDVLRARVPGQKSKIMPLKYAEGKQSKDLPLFGMDRVTPGGLMITVTEGEYDAMSVKEMMGDFPVVSIPLGTDGVLKCLENENTVNFLRSFNKIMVCFDADEAGQEAAKKFANVFVGKAHIVHLDQGKYKDANEYLQNGAKKVFSSLWWTAEKESPYTPGDIIPGEVILQRILEQEQEPYVEYPYEGLNKMLYGMHTPEVILVTAPDKVGKSTFTGVLVDHLLQTQDAPVADISLEDTETRRGKTLLSLRTQRPLHLPEEWELVDKKELAAIAHDRSIGSGQYFGYSNASASDVVKLIDRIKYLVTVLGCKYVIFDHLSFVTSFHAEDERKTLDRLSNELAVMTKAHDFCLIVVAHLNREGKVHGSSNLEKTCWTHIELNRDKENDDPAVRDVVECRVKRNRRYSRTGKFYLQFKEKPFGVREMDKAEAERILGITND